MPDVLIIGYGSPLRGDDNIGCQVAQMLESYYREDPEVGVIGSHQLTPEMAEDVAGSEFVLFLDAAVGTPAGNIELTTVRPRLGPMNFAHHLDPARLLGASVEICGREPRAELLTITGSAFELGDTLSLVVSQSLRKFFEQARAIVESHRHATANQLIH